MCLSTPLLGFFNYRVFEQQQQRLVQCFVYCRKRAAHLMQLASGKSCCLRAKSPSSKKVLLFFFFFFLGSGSGSDLPLQLYLTLQSVACLILLGLQVRGRLGKYFISFHFVLSFHSPWGGDLWWWMLMVPRPPLPSSLFWPSELCRDSSTCCM